MIAPLILAGIAIWLAVSALVCWLWGRFVRIGMVELKPEHARDDAPADSPTLPPSA
jgi:hypothetical protein